MFLQVTVYPEGGKCEFASVGVAGRNKAVGLSALVDRFASART